MCFQSTMYVIHPIFKEHFIVNSLQMFVLHDKHGLQFNTVKIFRI